MDNIPKKLRQLKRLKRMNRKQVCIFLDISEDTFKSWSCGRNKPSIANMEMLEDVFELEGIL
jgi:DNA-binding transcriptional regulator YiaG